MRTRRFVPFLALPVIFAIGAQNTLAESNCSSVSFASADAEKMTGELCMPTGPGPFPALVDLRARSCDGPQGIPTGWEQVALPSWGYAVLAIDSVAARGLGAKGCDWNALTWRQIIADAYGGLNFLARDSRIDPKRIAMLTFRAGIGTTAILADTDEASSTFAPGAAPRFAAFLAISPYCNLKFENPPRLYAPIRVFTGEKDDFEPADRCQHLAESFIANDANFKVTVYPDAAAGFDLAPPDSNFPQRDPTALHPGATTVSTHPQYSPWTVNLANCTIPMKSIFDHADPATLETCTRRGIHFQGTTDTAAQLQTDLRRELRELFAR